MPAEFETDVEEYPELDPEAEGEEVANSDARPWPAPQKLVQS